MLYKKEEKRLLKRFSLVIGTLLILIFAYSVLADHIIRTSIDETSFNFNEDVSVVYNISVNNTDATGNITQVNITIPGSFSFTDGTNRTDAGAHNFVNTSIVLSWFNASDLVGNLTKKFFGFNANASTPGTYNITVYTVNATGTYQSNISVIINDTTIPSSIEFGVLTYANNTFTKVNNVPVNVTATDNGVISSILIELFNSTKVRINSSSTATSPNFINFTGLSDGVYYYNATINDTYNNRNSTTTRIITVDTTPPNVSAPVNPVAYGNYSGTFVLNVSINDVTSNVSTVFFNVTNSTGTQNATFTASNHAGNFWNVSMNTAGFADGVYNVTVFANDSANNLNNSIKISRVTFDNTISTISYGNGTENDGINKSQTSVYVNVSFTESNFANITFSLHNRTATVNSTTFSSATYTINWTGLPNENYTYQVNITDTANSKNATALRRIVLDTTNPSISTYTCTPTSLHVDDVITCSCGGADSFTGVQSTSFTTNPSTTQTGTFTTSCSVTDYAGNSGSASVQYTVESAGGGNSGGGGGGGSSGKQNKESLSWTKITPGAATIMKINNRELGVKQISIIVNNPAQNVQITVIKYDGKPANVSISKTGKVYKYLEIKANNLNKSLSNAVIRIQVEKSWLNRNNLAKEKIVISKFDDAKKEWEELNTQHIESDALYEYYDAVLTSFSYFAIGEKVIVSQQIVEEEVQPVPEKIEAGGLPAIVIVALIVVILIITALVWIFIRKRKI